MVDGFRGVSGGSLLSIATGTDDGDGGLTEP